MKGLQVKHEESPDDCQGARSPPAVLVKAPSSALLLQEL